MKRIIGTIIVGMMFIFIFAILPILVGIITEAIANIITIDFIVKVISIISICSFIGILKK